MLNNNYDHLPVSQEQGETYRNQELANHNGEICLKYDYDKAGDRW